MLTAERLTKRFQANFDGIGRTVRTEGGHDRVAEEEIERLLGTHGRLPKKQRATVKRLGRAGRGTKVPQRQVRSPTPRHVARDFSPAKH